MTSPTSPAGIILAAGKGTRMKSDLPKVLHRVCGLPLAEWVGRAMMGAGIAKPIMVIGHGGELLQEALGDRYEYVWQREQLGTGHAALMASDLMAGRNGPVIVAPGDTPLLSEEVFSQLIEHHCQSGASCTVATAILEDPSGYGRIVRDDVGHVTRIVEQKDASPDQLIIKEVNSGVYIFDGPLLFQILPTLGNANKQGEYYLTDAVEAIAKMDKKVAALPFHDPGLLEGVNDRWQLSQAETEMRARLLKRHAMNGVTLQDAATTYIEADVQIGRDTFVLAGCHLLGDSKVGEGCKIGPNTMMSDCTIGDGCTVLMSHLKQCTLESKVKVGPFANIRPGTVLGEGSKIGNFVEVKNAQFAPGVSASHLSYVGDATVGARTNIGAGTITCNYDGLSKHRTTIGERVFVGSNSTLVAPVTIGDGAMTAAGSVITHDVPDDALGLGRSRQEVKEGWVSQWRKRRGS